MNAFEHHADPLGEAASEGLGRAVRLTSIGATFIQIFAQLRAERERLRSEQAERSAHAHRDQQRAAHQAHRLRWAPAHDPKWLRTADMTQVARAWGSAVPYVDSDVSAAHAIRKCEERLRELHPHAMEHYDRLRADGLALVEAMQKAAPFFTRDPNVRTGNPAPARPVLLPAEENPQAAEAARLARADFPHTVGETVRATTNRTGTPSGTRSPSPTQHPGQNRGM
ncbi:hypothetical protein [Nonomuraea sp. NPDC046570]|uniref:hypothetical protein n=1 Tax=Nonomuraea sp. NPDC046570 TaxID=3155255 RepID=UPI0033FB04B3